MSITLEALGLLIKRAQHRHHRAMDQNLAAIDLSLVQWNALREIDRHPGSSMHQLAELTFNSDQAFGTLTTRLLKLRLIERFPGPGRVTHHRLTATGKSLLDQGRGVMVGVLETSFASLTESDRDTLAALLAKMLGNGQAVTAPTRGQA